MTVRSDTGTCQTCGASFERCSTGRPRVYCSEPCTQRAWAAAHPDVIAVRRKRNYAKFGVRIRAKSAEWGKRNPEKVKANNQAWDKTENGKLSNKAKMHRRRARKLNALGSFTRAEFKALCSALGNICLDCREPTPFGKLEADHIVSLAKGGRNDIGNIQPLCRSCNALKGTDTMNFITDYALEGVVINDPRQYGVAA